MHGAGGVATLAEYLRGRHRALPGARNRPKNVALAARIDQQPSRNPTCGGLGRPLPTLDTDSRTAPLARSGSRRERVPAAPRPPPARSPELHPAPVDPRRCPSPERSACKYSLGQSSHRRRAMGGSFKVANQPKVGAQQSRQRRSTLRPSPRIPHSNAPNRDRSRPSDSIGCVPAHHPGERPGRFRSSTTTGTGRVPGVARGLEPFTRIPRP